MKTSTLVSSVCLAVLVGCSQEPPAPSPAPKAQKRPIMPAVSGNPTAAAEAPPATAPPVPAAGAPGATTPQTPTPASSVVVAEESTATPHLEKDDFNIPTLQEAVNSYVRDTKRKPKDFQELVAAHYLTGLPKAPKGKRYTIDQATMIVNSVNQ